MKLKLKENPREWQKHLLVLIVIFDALLTILLSRGVMPATFYRGVQPVLALVLAAGLWRPGWFRGFYRAGMTVNHYVGLTMGRVLLTVFFFVVVTPLGLLLRATGRDLLKLRRLPPGGSYWQKCRPPSSFDRMF
jgi:hypothetical protein